ncbi:hypothetical protein GF342_02620 [Candidatus Woesearchaeota archaeon]|nr:hypothetical protein [Candidatus Woesearchaeota archaeon]
MANKSDDEVQRALQAKRHAEGVLKQYRALGELWLSADPRAQTLCRDVIESKDAPDGAYATIVSNIADSGVRQWFDYMVGMGSALEQTAKEVGIIPDRAQKPFVPANASAYFSRMTERVRGEQTNLRSRLEKAERIIARLQPKADNYDRLMRDFDREAPDTLGDAIRGLYKKGEE